MDPTWKCYSNPPPSSVHQVCTLITPLENALSVFNRNAWLPKMLTNDISRSHLEAEQMESIWIIHWRWHFTRHFPVRKEMQLQTLHKMSLQMPISNDFKSQID